MIHAVLESAIVIYLYVYEARAYPVCTGSLLIDLVDLFGAKGTDERSVRWKKHEDGLAKLDAQHWRTFGL